MSRKIDLLDKKFGKLLVIEESGRDPSGKVFWKCKCDCGNTTTIRGSTLLSKNGTKSCGCLSKKHFINLVGNKFNMLNIVEYIGKNKNKNNIYKAVCECGKSIIVEGSDVKTGKIQSCGCKRFLTQRKEDSLVLSIFNDYRKKAEYRGYSFHLDLESFKKIVKSNCHYCGAGPMNSKKIKYYHDTAIFLYNGIDRKNNDEGYMLNNVVPCCRICNQAKHNLTENFFLEWVEKVNTFQKSKKD